MDTTRTSEIIRQYRSKIGSYASMAREIGATRQTIHNWASGRNAPSLGYVLKMLYSDNIDLNEMARELLVEFGRLPENGGHNA